MRTQEVIYKTLGLDRRAGFDGRAPAFRLLESHKVGKAELLASVGNCARDPIHVLRAFGTVSERHHKALLALVDLVDSHQAVGVRAMRFDEAVDGGRFPDVSAHALDMARQMCPFERAFSAEERDLLLAVAIDGRSLADLARGGRWSRSRNTVRGRLLRVLDQLAGYFSFN